jgi:hypothetical protein
MKKIFITTLLSLTLLYSFSQSVTIDPKANLTPIVEIKSTNEGMVLPKMTVAQRNAILGLTAGTQVYCTDCTPYGPYSFDGGSWVAMFQTSTVSPITYTVGQMAQGGMVIWIDPASGGQHGLAVAMNDTNAALWDQPPPYTKRTGAWSQGYYGGEFNTNQILAVIQQDGLLAARVKYVNEGGYGDWYMPSSMELDLIYTLRNTIGISSFANTTYASSSETNNSTFYSRNFATGTSNSDALKYNNYRTRAVRRF